MKLLSFLHRWSGGLIGLLLAILGLTGAILVWEGEWISLPHAHDPVAERVETLGKISEREAAAGATRITFASDEIGLHHVAKEGGAGSYVAQDGTTVASWSSQWERPELWLFDLHHHLFAGETGETVAGIAGIFGLLFVITGSILWWRSRRAFRWRCGRRKFQPGPIVAHHRDIGILVAPLLLVSFLTGIGMLFPSATKVALSPWGKLETRTKPPEARACHRPGADRRHAGRRQGALSQSRASPADHPGQARRAIFGPPAPAVRMDAQRPHQPVLRRREASCSRSTIRRLEAAPPRSTRPSIRSIPARSAASRGSWR